MNYGISTVSLTATNAYIRKSFNPKQIEAEAKKKLKQSTQQQWFGRRFLHHLRASLQRIIWH